MYLGGGIIHYNADKNDKDLKKPEKYQYCWYGNRNV